MPGGIDMLLGLDLIAQLGGVAIIPNRAGNFEVQFGKFPNDFTNNYRGVLTPFWTRKDDPNYVYVQRNQR